MLNLADEKLKSKMIKDGSHLKQTRVTGGLSAGILAVGIFFAAVGILVMLMMIMEGLVYEALAFGGVCIVLGAILIALGYRLKIKRINGYIKYYQNNSGYNEKALTEFDTEFQKGEVFLITKGKKLDKMSLSEAGVFTANWFKVPFMSPINYSGLYHVEDIVAVWYQKEFVKIELREYMECVVILDCHEKFTVFDTDITIASEIIDQVAKRNPKVITSRKFFYEGKEYDVLSNPKEIATLYKSIC